MITLHLVLTHPKLVMREMQGKVNYVDKAISAQLPPSDAANCDQSTLV